MNNTRYNPITAAATAAWSELSSDRAINFYQNTALTAAINTLEFTIDAAEGWYMAANLAYQLGAMARVWFNTFTAKPAPTASSMLLCPAPCAGLLPETCSADRPALVTPAPTIDTPAVTVTTETVPLEKLGIRELKKLASDRKIPKYSKLSKTALIAALTS